MVETVFPGGKMPEITLDKLGGGSVKIGGTGRWQLLVVYRGRHCPLCKAYLATLESLMPRAETAGVDVLAVSADSADRDDGWVRETGYSGDVGFGLTIENMQALGVYISHPRSPEEAPAPFAEPGLFITNPDGVLQIADKSNAPFVRPDIKSVLSGLEFIRKNDYPVRGTWR